ncbi:MAG: ATP-binding protein [Hyphomicrobiales bacterium]
MRILEITALGWRAVEELLHPSALTDALTAARHRSFIASHLIGGFAALAAFPIYLAWHGPTSWHEMALFAWLVAPLGVAVFLSRTGRYAAAHLLSAFTFTNLIAWAALLTGGLHSFAIAWFAVVPIEAALSGRPRVVAGTVAMVALAIAGVAGMTWYDFLPAPMRAPLPAEAISTISILVAVVYTGFVALRVDALHRAGEKIARAGEARYRMLADNVSDVITRHSGNGDVVFASSAVARVFGISPADALGDGFFRRVHVADRPGYLSALSRALHDRATVTVEFRIRRNGDAHAEDDYDRAAPDFLWVEMRCRPVAVDADGGIGAGVVAAIRDISELKAHEERLEAAREAAEHASHAKTRFLANVSHELRTPLNAIIGFSDILRQELFGRLEYARHREYVDLIHDSGNHLLQVVNDILDMSKIEAGAFEIVREPFNVGETLEGCRQMMAHTASERGLNLGVDVAAGLPELCADRRACKQIVLNLLANALKFTDAGGSVTLGARLAGDEMTVFVRDTGIGIAAKDLPRLGTPFVQADSAYDRKYEGTGLGLSMVKGLAELHGGRFRIESELGRGTCVSVYLPLNHVSNDKVAAPDEESAAPRFEADNVRQLKRA